jgi:hypothetical protein
MNRHIFGLALIVLASSVIFASYPSQAPAVTRAPAFKADPSWPAIPNNWVLGEVSSVAADSQDHVWILHRPATVPEEQRAKTAPPVLEFESSGRFVGSWGGAGNGYEWPEREHGIYVDPKNNVWIGGNNGYGTPLPPGDSDDMLLKFTTAGKFLMQVGHRNTSTGNADTKNLHQPADAFFLDGEVFVADGYGNHRVIVLDSETGAFKRMWGAFGRVPTAETTNEQFGLVHAIKVSKDGMVYVADRSNQRVQVFTTAGKYVTQVTIGARGQTAAGLALSPDGQQQFLYIANLGDSQVVILNRKTLETVGTFGSPGSEPGQFQTLHHLAVDSKGNIYTAEIGRGRRAQKFVKQ